MALPDPYAIEPLAGPFDATVRPPGSKSITNRALVIAALAEGASKLTGVLFSDDSRYMMAALQDLGFELEIDEPNTTVTVHGQGGRIPKDKADLFVGNAGTAMRFLTAMLCLGHGTYTIDGIPRMRQRPIGQLVDPLRQLGAKIDYLGAEGYPPLRIAARGLAGGDLHIGPTISSQYISALMQIGPYTNGGIVLRFNSTPISFPYIEMTSRVMESYGCGVSTSFSTELDVRPGQYQAQPYDIEPDASNASYFAAIAATGAVNSRCCIEDLSWDSIQGDIEFGERLQQMGAICKDTLHGFEVMSTGGLTGLNKAWLNDMPDMAQTLAVVALFAKGPTEICDVGNLRVKETDRMAAIKNECEKLGATVEIVGDDIHLTPPEGNVLRHGDGEPISDERPVFIDTYDDHRMAMSFAVAGLRQAGIRINDPACVNKTYPGFFDDLEQLRQGVRA